MLLLFLSSILISLSVSEECGRKPPQVPMTEMSQMIVGGREAKAHAWPWQLSLQILRENTTDDYRHTCGASLIDKYWALTASHCVEARMLGLNDPRREDPANFRLLLGAHDLTNLAGVQIRYINKIVKHDRWVPNPYIGYPNDIALLRLTEAADLDWVGVELACLPDKQDFDFTGDECWITGWGKTDWQNDTIPSRLQEAEVVAISNEQCARRNPGYIRETHICPGTGYPNACSGDSGGPVNCHHGGTWYVSGLASWTIATCRGSPPVYTRISYFYDWIKYFTNN